MNATPIEPNPALELFSYFRSSSSYRVRIALHLKGLSYSYKSIHLLRDGGEQHQDTYSGLNPLREVPSLRHGELVLAQSMAILTYLDQLFPTPALFPQEASAKALVVQACEIINSGTQPLQNLGVLQKLGKDFSATEEQRQAWSKYWIERGLRAFETLIQPHSGQFCFSDTVTAADLYLVPQLFNARRFAVELEQFPLIQKIEAHCLKLEAFTQAEPSLQPDAGA